MAEYTKDQTGKLIRGLQNLCYSLTLYAKLRLSPGNDQSLEYFILFYLFMFHHWSILIKEQSDHICVLKILLQQSIENGLEERETKAPLKSLQYLSERC